MKTYNVLFISLDKDLLDQNSRVFERHKNYAKYFNKLYVSVLSKEKQIINDNNLEVISFGGSNKLFVFFNTDTFFFFCIFKSIFYFFQRKIL